MRLFAKRQILVVDDDPQVLKLFVRILANAKYPVTAASSGSEAIETLQTTPVDLVVLDLNMPNPDGFEVLKLLRSKQPGVKILVISGLISGPMLKASELLGASASLSKTDASRQLLDTVRKLIG